MKVKPKKNQFQIIGCSDAEMAAIEKSRPAGVVKQHWRLEILRAGMKVKKIKI